MREAVESADVVVSVVSFGPDRQALDPAWLGPQTLFVAVDYDMQAPAALAREAFFVVDERDAVPGHSLRPDVFAGYPDPDATLGELLRGDAPGGRRRGGRPAAASSSPTWASGLRTSSSRPPILARAEQLGLGRILPR